MPVGFPAGLPGEARYKFDTAEGRKLPENTWRKLLKTQGILVC